MSYDSRIQAYLGVGTAASRPVSLNISTSVLGLWYATDTGIMSAWDGSAWTSVTSGNTLAGDTDVSISGPAAGQSLVYNGSKWANTDQLGELPLSWPSGITVQNTTVYLLKSKRAGTVESLDYRVGSGSFTVAVQINGVNVTSLSAVAVSSTTWSNTTASGANTYVAGDVITFVITGATVSPTDAFLQLNVKWTS